MGKIIFKSTTVKKLLRVLIAAAITIIINSGCDSPTAPYALPEIIYTVSGGFAGGIHKKLVIDGSGNASLVSEYPVLKERLSPHEYNSLLFLFTDFNSLPDTSIIKCVDSFIFSVEYRTGGHTKIVSADNCALSDSNNPFIIRLNIIFKRLDQLANSVYNNQASWLGLSSDYKINKEAFFLGEPVRFTFTLKNPTKVERTIYFKDNNIFYFSIQKTDYPYLYYTYPPANSADSDPQVKIMLASGEEKSIEYLWNQDMNDSRGNSIKAPAGMYSIGLGFIGNKVQGGRLLIDIIDPSIPLEGRIIEDYGGSGTESTSYNFNLQIKNWTNKPLILNFPDSRKISTKLYGEEIAGNKELIYESPLEPDGLAHQETIPAGSIVVYSERISKDSLNLGSGFLYYAKINLLCNNFSFGREAELRIFK